MGKETLCCRALCYSPHLLFERNEVYFAVCLFARSPNKHMINNCFDCYGNCTLFIVAHEAACGLCLEPFKVWQHTEAVTLISLQSHT